MTLVSTSGASFLSAPRVSTPFFFFGYRRDAPFFILSSTTFGYSSMPYPITSDTLVYRLLILFNKMRFAVCYGNHGSAEGKFGTHRSTAAGIRTDGESWQE